MEVEFSLHRFEEFHENLSGWNQTVPSTRTNRRTGGGNLTVAFRNFVNAPKIQSDNAV
jgi:hypothetical protein